MVVESRGGWICDGCRDQNPAGDRMRCAEGCDFDLCARCWADGAEPSRAEPAPASAAAGGSFVVAGAGMPQVRLSIDASFSMVFQWPSNGLPWIFINN